VAFSRDGTNGYQAFLLGFSDTNNLVVYMSSSGASWDVAGGKSLGAISLNQWVHLAVVRKGTQFYTFKNGALMDTWSSALSLMGSAGRLTIGKSDTVYFSGHIDEVRISNSARWVANFTPQNYEYSVTALLVGDYTFNTAADNSGTDITANLTVSVVYGTGSAIYTLTNGSIYSGYVTKLQARGFGVYQYNPIEAVQESLPSQNTYGIHAMEFQQQYMRELTVGNLAAQKMLDRDKSPHTNLTTLTVNANRTDAAMMAWLTLDIGDMVAVRETMSGIYGNYYIQSVKFSLGVGGIINFTWLLRQDFSLKRGLSLITLQTTSGTHDGLDYGYVPQIVGFPYRTYSVWIYSTSGDGDILAPFSDAAGLSFGIYSGGLLYYYQKGTITPGTWVTLSTISLNAWHHLVFTRDCTDPANQVLLYVDGSLTTLSQTSTQTGPLADETGVNFVIGNDNAVSIPFNATFGGSIKDVRIYNRILTPGEVFMVYTRGPGIDESIPGLVFHGPCVRTQDYAGLVGTVLTTENKLLDNINGMIGTPHGAPHAQAF
jgi:hypothetical protein